MFDIGLGEMVLLAAIALIAIGPKQLPEVARALGKLLGEVKKTMGDVTSSVANAREETDRAIRKVTDDLTGVTDGINRDVAHGLNLQPHADSKPIHHSPIVPLPNHAGDPPWVVNPDLPNPNDAPPSVIPATGAAPFAMAPARVTPPAKPGSGEST